jgi:hypothetical protein
MMQKERLGDRRSDLRFEIIGQLWGSLETVEPLPLRNVGRGGALVESRLPLPSDSVQGVRLVFQGRASDLQARVRHVTPIVDPEGGERYLIGLEFVTPGEEALARIDHLVAVSSGRGLNSVEA